MIPYFPETECIRVFAAPGGQAASLCDAPLLRIVTTPAELVMYAEISQVLEVLGLAHDIVFTTRRPWQRGLGVEAAAGGPASHVRVHAAAVKVVIVTRSAAGSLPSIAAETLVLPVITVPPGDADAKHDMEAVQRTACVGAIHAALLVVSPDRARRAALLGASIVGEDVPGLAARVLAYTAEGAPRRAQAAPVTGADEMIRVTRGFCDGFVPTKPP